jgi:phosphoenolpyruvate-protein kinase (PTS system EI component)
VRLTGSPIAPGLAMGTVSLFGDILECRRRSTPAATRDVDAEWKRIEAAFAATRRDLAEAADPLEQEVGSRIADAFRAHQMMLDPSRW